MAGAMATQGLDLLSDLFFNNVTTDVGSTFQLGLFTNTDNLATLKGLPLGSITEPTGGGYARITLTRGSFTSVNGAVSYAQQTFTATGGDYTGDIYGYFICSTGTTPRLIAVEINADGPHMMTDTSTYKVTPTFTVT